MRAGSRVTVTGGNRCGTVGVHVFGSESVGVIRGATNRGRRT